jgi:hypothetical protein
MVVLAVLVGVVAFVVGHVAVFTTRERSAARTAVFGLASVLSSSSSFPARGSGGFSGPRGNIHEEAWRRHS